MKKLVSTILMVAMLLTIVPLEGALASTIPNISINGEKFVSPSGEPNPYINTDERTMIPIRFFAAALGVPDDEEHIVWEQETQTATIIDGKNTVIIPLGSKEITVNGKTVVMDTVAEMKNHRVFIPARFLAEGLDANVQWDGDNQRVVIFTKEFLEGHYFNETVEASDIDDPFLAEPFYEKIAEKYRNYKTFGNGETFMKRIKESHDWAVKVEYDVDYETGMVIVTLPKYDQDNFYMILDAMDGNQYLNPGSYTISFKNAIDNGKLFILGMADRKYGAAVMYRLYGFVRDGELIMMTGTKGRELFMLPKEG